MKFLCVPCDSAMRLQETAEREPGSLTVVYSCPECGYEMAMLTNLQETQMVRSLGVRIGPEMNQAELAAAASSPTGMSTEAAPAGKARCPFSAMLGETATESVVPPTATTAAAGDGPAWTAGALARLDAIPEMVRPMARAGIEMVARETGLQLIDETALEAARARFGM